MILAPFFLTACQNWATKIAVPEPLRAVEEQEQLISDKGKLGPGSSLAAQTREPPSKPQTRITQTPSTPAGLELAGLSVAGDSVELEGDPLQISVENLPLAAFINEVFGNMLGLSFEIAQELQAKKDLVTLRVVEPTSPSDIYRLATKVLNTYGIAVSKVDNHLSFNVSTSTPAGEPPILVSGRALPNVPVSHRPIFQLVPLVNVRNIAVKSWLSVMFKDPALEVYEDPVRNAIVLQGPAAIVSRAVEAIALLDQPSMKGRYSLRIDPLFITPDELAQALVLVLKSEGYAASDKPDSGSVIVLPMEQFGAVLVFTAEQKLRDHIEQWALSLDKPSMTSSDGQDLFYFPIKNTRAKDLVAVLNKITGGLSKESQIKKSAEGKGATVKTTVDLKPALVVDEARNALLFYGSAAVWSRMLPIIHKMDVPPKQVLVEVTVAEVTLTEEDQFGIEWLINGSLNGYDSIPSTLGGLAVGGGGFTYTLSLAGQTRFVLNALASDQRVNILSTPRLMVKSGSDASIEVGTDVPIVTSQSTETDLPGSSILQNIQYRKTGVLLNVKPIIHAGRRVDLEITQEISAAEANTVSNVDSPSILTRRVTTDLSIRDGGSVLLGGMISTTGGSGTKGVPGLMNIPVAG
ncbi:MAG: secretin N-terminal domain-containing protein, partial [Pseudomonadota bacterium]|nr:secretin N-terminal domain-containing protein [Pseudomonadota bacterium]